jgi:hypothetical protein
MNKITLTGELSPKHESDNYALIDTNRVRGSLYTVNGLEDLNNIPEDLKKEGMLAYCKETNITYQLLYDSDNILSFDIDNNKIYTNGELLNNIYTKTEINNKYYDKDEIENFIDSIDLSVFYNKTEIDGKLSDINNSIDSISFDDYYNKNEINGKLALKADVTYVDTAIDNVQDTISDLDTRLSDIDLSNYYTKDNIYNKTEVDDKFDEISFDNYYNKTEIDDKIDFIDFSDYYNKTETDAKIDEIVGGYFSYLLGEIGGLRNRIDALENQLHSDEEGNEGINMRLSQLNEDVHGDDGLNNRVSGMDDRINELEDRINNM